MSGKWVRFALLAAAGGLLSAGPARAELTWPKLTLATFAGASNTDPTYAVDSGVPFGVRGGFTVSKYFGLEGSYGKTYGTGRRVASRNFPLDQYGIDLLLNAFPNSRINPYLLGGWAQISLDEPKHVVLHMTGVEVGGGLKIRLFRETGARWDLRLDARDTFVRNVAPLADAGDRKHNFFFTAGISMTLANPERDTDGDGVLDRFDKCPGTVRGASVDPFGCPLDYDDDGVPDGLDQCPSTPRGAIVDANGCPSDSDGDGVMDGIDLCNDTPKGVLVDAAGCEKDTDGDGVFDGLDKCPGTPPRVMVDEFGCPLTPTVSATELDFLDSGSLVLDQVHFRTGSATLLPDSYPSLDEAGAMLVKWPEVQVEIGGYTDSQGSEEKNRMLSETRAKAVLAYLLKKFPSLDGARFRAVGYGEADPVATNDTAAGRAKNRRVEFKVLNPGVLHREK